MPRRGKVLFMHWLIALLRLQVVNNIMVPTLQMKSLRLTHGGCVTSPKSPASERQGLALNFAGLIPTPRRSIAGDTAFSMGNVKARSRKAPAQASWRKETRLESLDPTWGLFKQRFVSSLWSRCASGFLGFTLRGHFKCQQQMYTHGLPIILIMGIES